jgi:hypothetical protein
MITQKYLSIRLLWIESATRKVIFYPVWVMLEIDYLVLDQAVLRRNNSRYLSQVEGIRSDSFS